jgi:hypothetical protein
MTPTTAGDLRPFPAQAGKEQTSRLPVCPTTGGKPGARVTPLACESDPHPVGERLSARVFEHDSMREAAGRMGSLADHPPIERFGRPL